EKKRRNISVCSKGTAGPSALKLDSSSQVLTHSRTPGDTRAGGNLQPSKVRRRSGGSEFLVEGVARAANGADRVPGAALVDGLAQPADMNVDGALVDIDVCAPDAVEKLLARINAART